MNYNNKHKDFADIHADQIPIIGINIYGVVSNLDLLFS